MSDADRSALYAAELAAFDGTDLESVRQFHQVRALIDAVVADSWWPRGGVDVRAARSDAHSSSTRCTASGGGLGMIRLARSQTTIDSTDRRLDLHVNQLTDAFSAAGLDVGVRHWPAPPAGTGRAFAL